MTLILNITFSNIKMYSTVKYWAILEYISWLTLFLLFVYRHIFLNIYFMYLFFLRIK